MKKIIPFILGILLGISCSSDETTSVESGKLVLSSDKAAILADGRDTVKLSVRDEQGNDVTALCGFDADGKVLSAAIFTTQEVGNYSITARHENVVSNVIKINAVKELEVKIISDKNRIVADGVDGAALLLKTNLDEDVTAEARFFVNGQPLTSAFFTTTDAGSYTLTAEYKGQPLAGKMVIAAEWQLPYVHRLLAEEYTSVACPNCPRVGVALNGFMSKNDKIIAVALHTRKGDSPDPFEKKPETAELRQAFSVNSVPLVILDRFERWDEREETLLGAIREEADIAIALDARVEGQQVKVTARITGKKVFMGVKYVAMLIEDQLEGTQSNAPLDYRHNHVLREMSGVWGENIDVAVGRPTVKETVFPLSAYKTKNCSVVVFVAKENRAVLNTQKVKVGQRTGY